LINALLATSKKNRQWASGKFKKFDQNSALCTKEKSTFKPILLGTRISGIQTNNLKFVLEKKSLLSNLWK
jgi:ribosomal protein L14